MPSKRPGPDQLSHIETASQDEIAALQLSRMQATLKRAYEHVPHYKKAFDAAGVEPGDLRQLSDLARFPFTVKSDLRDNYPFGMFAVPREQVATHSRLVRHDRQAHGGGLHQDGHRQLV
jgi:phenylacetate-CoA ligase